MIKYLFLIFSCCCCVVAQPSLPIMTRQVVWIQPVTNNVTGYVVSWGTNSVQIPGHLNLSTVIKLEPGINTVVLRSVNGNALSDAITNIVRMGTFELQETTNNGITWRVKTNFSYAVEHYKTSAWYRVKMNGLTP